jgi:RNA polymerase-binding protein DksA
MESTAREGLEHALRHRRSELVREATGREAALRTIAEARESEIEERAQEEETARVLAHLEDRERSEIREIDAALDRIAEGSYGSCARCDGAIEIDRLAVLPATTRCVRCASAAERAAAGATPEED